MLLDSLSHYFSIYLLVVHHFSELPHSFLREPLLDLCSDVHILPWPTPEESAHSVKLIPSLGEIAFDAIHVFKLPMLPFALPYARTDATARPLFALDLDDFESKKYARFSDLAARNGDIELAHQYSRLNDRYKQLEQSLLPAFDSVFVCSEEDREEIATTHKLSNVVTVPNAVSIPIHSSLGEPRSDLVLLFPATLQYYPNEDAAYFFCETILPLIRKDFTDPFQVWLVGGRPGDRLQKLSNHNGVTVSGPVDSMEPYYQEAAIVIVPLRAGGGTRLKILEAASYERAIVSTSMGAEGLSVCHDKEVLLADTPEGFAYSCLRLMRDTTYRRQLGTEAYAWVSKYHTIDNVRHSIKVGYSAVLSKYP